MNEFRKTGTNYVSEWNGSPSNDGTNPETPWAHPANAPSGNSATTIVGTGIYYGAEVASRQMEADGQVILDCQMTGQIAVNYSLKGFTIRNASQLVGTASGRRFTDCIFEEVFRLGINSTVSPVPSNNANHLIFLQNSLGEVMLQRQTSIYNSIVLLPLTESGCVNFGFNYGSPEATIIYSGTESLFAGNCWQGKVIVGGVEYELKRKSDGSSREGGSPLIPDLASIFPDCYSVHGNFAQDPKFIDVRTRVASVDSPLLSRINTYDSSLIAGVTPGKALRPNYITPNTSFSFSGISETAPDEWRLSADEGYIEIITKIASFPTKVPKIGYLGNLDFGHLAPDNVPDYFPASYTSLSANGLKPNRLAFKMRTSNKASQPVFDADWDNFTGVPGQFYDQLWNEIPTLTAVSGTVYGAANPLSIGGVNEEITARWLHIRIRLTNLRYF